MLATASELATLGHASLVLYRAVGIQPDLPTDLLRVTNLSLEEVLLRNAREDLTRLAAAVPGLVVDQIVATFATPWDGICRAGREHDADLIIIGSHGYGALDRLLGTTAGKVVHHADRNVLVVRAVRCARVRCAGSSVAPPHSNKPRGRAASARAMRWRAPAKHGIMRTSCAPNRTRAETAPLHRQVPDFPWHANR
ncbi:MAG: universal stress protein [Myxococcota bacterium]|nr:universal stress protein [Myxococcota bacterium]